MDECIHELFEQAAVGNHRARASCSIQPRDESAVDVMRVTCCHIRYKQKHSFLLLSGTSLNVDLSRSTRFTWTVASSLSRSLSTNKSESNELR